MAISELEKLVRPWLIAFIVLPISVFLNLKQWLASFRETNIVCSEEDHNVKVSRIQAHISQLASSSSSSSMIRTDRDANDSHSVRIVNKSAGNTIRMKDLDKILALSPQKQTIRVEPGVTVGRVTNYLLSQNLQLECTLEMEDATLGGLALTQGMTTHSHICGLFSNTVESFEFVSGNGEVMRTTKGEPLHEAVQFSHGSLGLLVALEVRVVPVFQSRFVLVKYTLCTNVEKDFKTQYQALIDRQPFFAEAIIYSPHHAVFMEGNLFANSNTKQYPVNEQGRFWKPWFFKRVQLAKDGEEELIPVRDYLMRHDRSLCMTMDTVFPVGNEPWFRYLLGWTLPPKISFLKSSHTPKTREASLRDQVYQDVAFPLASFPRVFDFCDRTFGIYPLLCYPCRVDANSKGMIQTQEPNTMFLNLGVYGVPRALKEKNGVFPTLTEVRNLEALIRKVGGFQHTYCDTLQTREEFETMFHHELLEEWRKKLGSDKLFPIVYEKVRPGITIRKKNFSKRHVTPPRETIVDNVTF